ncbi:tetratricopeptide (TPR) repeat protein [Neorhizobium sp. 2083]|uniref:hypothetical protein n=1 Tax=Neorhizobium sp. 2083 TaxID=2817762 RepID=UPI002861EE43|nr:hypothetical protein [Neorhizobium sp. 2083]MDR6816456.1 tetratricopeptide (TPR) repeat protein [Neorhizobium sp. 2083]
MALLLKNDDCALRAVCLASNSNSVLVCFSPWSQNPSLDAYGFAEDLCTKYQWPAVFVIPARNDWYQSDGCWEVVSAAAEVTSRFRRVVTYGSSMGGYAALNYASDLNAKAALAVMPQFSIDRSKVPFEERWSQEASSTKFVRDKISDESLAYAKAFVLYDKFYGPDKLQVKKLGALANVEAICLPLMGHSGPGGRLLSDALAAIRTDDLADFPSFVKKNYRKASRDSATRLFQLARLSRFLSTEQRMMLLKRAAAKEPMNLKVDLVMAELLIKSSEWARAANVLLDAVRRHPTVSIFWSYLGSCQSRMLQFEVALQSTDKAIRFEPSNAYLYHQKARCYMNLKQFRNAFDEQLKALALDPHNELYTNQRDEISGHLA